MANPFDQFDPVIDPNAPPDEANPFDRFGEPAGMTTTQPPAEPTEQPVKPGTYDKKTLLETLATPFNALTEHAIGGLEAVGTIASGAAGELAGGLLGLGAAAGAGAEAGAETVERVSDAFQYTPRTERGEQYVMALGSILEPVGGAMAWVEDGLGNATLQATGSPGAATVMHTAPTAVLEALGLGALRRTSKAADAAIEAQRMVEVNPGMTAADVANEMMAPEEMSYQQVGELIRRGDTKKLAEQVMVDPERVAAFEELGIPYNPGMVSRSEGFIRAEQAIKSQPDSDIAAREAESITRLGEEADKLIKESGGEIDRNIFETDFRERMESKRLDLEEKERVLFDRVRNAIDVDARHTPRASAALVDHHMRISGDDPTGLPGPVREIHRLLNRTRAITDDAGKKVGEEPILPTYGRLNRLRQEIANGYKGKGAFGDMARGDLDQAYKAVSTDLENIATEYGVGGMLKAANKLTSSRKRLEENMTKLMSKDLGKSILQELTLTGGRIAKGRAQELKALMKRIPPDMRGATAATMLNDLFTQGSRRKGSSVGQGFAQVYDTLERNPSVKETLFEYLPEHSRAKFDAIGKVAQGIYRAKALENTSRSARDFLRGLQDLALPDKIYQAVGAVGRMGPLRYTPIGGLADTAALRAERQAKRISKADKLMTSAAFNDAMNLAMEGRVKEAEKLLNRSPVWQAYRKALGEATLKQLAMVGPIAWLTQQDEPLIEREAAAVGP